MKFSSPLEYQHLSTDLPKSRGSEPESLDYSSTGEQGKEPFLAGQVAVLFSTCYGASLKALRVMLSIRPFAYLLKVTIITAILAIACPKANELYVMNSSLIVEGAAGLK